MGEDVGVRALVALVGVAQHPGTGSVGQDLIDGGVGQMPVIWQVPENKIPVRWPLTPDKVRHVGDSVAAVVAEDAYIARDALDLIEVDYEVLQAATGAESTTEDGKPLVHDEIDNNTCFVGFAENEDRSNMNVTFNLTDNNNSEIFEKICKERDIIGINGHRSVGGYRASLYNALKIDSVRVLIDCMKKLESLINEK